MEFVSVLNGIVWGPFTVAFIIFAGIYLSYLTGFLQIRKFYYMLKKTVFGMFSEKTKKADSFGVSPFQAVSTALAGTIGTGSIAGIATAITLGGPGTVFWMWVSAFFGMVTKYSEIVLSVKFREKDSDGKWIGGPMYYIQNGIGAKWLAVIFSLCGIGGCFGIGNTVQSNSIASSLESAAGISPWITATVLCVLATAVILGGIQSIARFNEKLVPAMTAIYIGCALAVLTVNAKEIPAAFSMILKSAFNFRSSAWGIAGYGMMNTIRYGISRGIFSNEAGLGSAPMAHAASNTASPAFQGLWGMFEVFFTTMVICTLTALVVLTGGLWNQDSLSGAALSIASFDGAISGSGSIGVTLATVLFALSSIFGWAYYGEICIGYLCNKSPKAVSLYRVIYVALVFAGAVGKLEFVWGISEVMNGLMAIPNLIGVIALGKIVRSETGQLK